MWQQDLPTPSSPLLSELKQWQYFWKQYKPTLQLPGNLIEWVKYTNEGIPACKFCLLLVVTFLLVLPMLSVHSLACDESSNISEIGWLSDERLSWPALMHLHHDRDIDVDKICIIFVTKHKRRMLQGCIPENGKRPRNYNVQPRLVGGGVGEK